MVKIFVTLREQDESGTLWQGDVAVAEHVYNGFTAHDEDGWQSHDEFDDWLRSWDVFCDAISQSLPDELRWKDWYVYNYKRA